MAPAAVGLLQLGRQCHRKGLLAAAAREKHLHGPIGAALQQQIDHRGPSCKGGSTRGVLPG